MNRLKLLPLAAAMLLIAACGGRGKVLLDEQRDFQNDVWNHFTPEKFEVDVQNIEDYYNIDFFVAVDTALMRGNSLPMTVNIYSPEGERRMFYTDVPFIENGRWKGESMGDGYRLMSKRVRSYFSFNTTGLHRIEVAQATSQYDMEGIRFLKVEIAKAPLDYDGL